MENTQIDNVTDSNLKLFCDIFIIILFFNFKMDKYDDLITQVKVRKFKRVPFTLYNYVSEESGFLHMLSKKGYDNDIDNLECLQIEITDDEKKDIKKGINGRFDDFSQYIEERTDNTMNVFIMKQYGCVFVVKPKNTILT